MSIELTFYLNPSINYIVSLLTLLICTRELHPFQGTATRTNSSTPNNTPLSLAQAPDRYT